MASSNVETPSAKKVPFQHLVKLNEQYRDCLEKDYGDPTDLKVKKALDDDQWRYKTLPALLKAKKNKKKDVFLDLRDLERLVQWKIKHGKNRPFLIGLVRKNDAATVKFVTQSAFSQLPSPPAISDILAALKTLDALKGVGPATGSLILSIYDPEVIPFFEDELYIWLCRGPEDLKQNGSEVKLKYNVKEYEQLLNEFGDMRKRLQKEPAPAWMLEKVAFVLARQMVAHRAGDTKSSRLKANETKRKAPDDGEVANEVIDSDVEGSADDDDDNDDDEGEDDMESEDGMEAEENMSSQGFEELGDDVPEEITDEDRKRYENGISDEGRKSKVAASEVFLRRLLVEAEGRQVAFDNGSDIPIFGDPNYSPDEDSDEAYCRSEDEADIETDVEEE